MVADSKKATSTSGFPSMFSPFDLYTYRLTAKGSTAKWSTA